ncbi:MAG: tetratricopeptide repeat protein [Thermodesulfobacteriota bacterium]
MSIRNIVIAVSAAALMAATGCASSNTPSLLKQAEAGKNLAEAYMQEGKTRAALRELEKAQTQNPQDPEIYFDMGTVYLALEEPQLAIQALSRALKLNPDYAVAKNTLGSAYITVEQWDKAIPLFQELSENLIYATPQYPLLNLGYIYYRKGDYLKSTQCYLKAIDYSADFAQAWRGLGRTYLSMGKTKDAIIALEKAVSLAPRFEWAYLDLGDALEQAGRVSEAVADWKKVGALAPTSDAAKEAEARLARYSQSGGE